MKQFLLLTFLFLATPLVAKPILRNTSNAVSHHEIWTVDQVRFAPPKAVQELAPLVNDHDMAAVVKRLDSLGIAFEHSVTQVDTANLSDRDLAQINGLPKYEPFAIPWSGKLTINVILMRKPIAAVASAPKMLPGFAVTEADYPPAALRSRRERRVDYVVDVDATGIPHNCITTTTADPEFDAKTCQVVTARVRFQPALDVYGHHIESRFGSYVNWLIGRQSGFFDTMQVNVYIFRKDGSVDYCLNTINGDTVKDDSEGCAGSYGPALSQLLGGPTSNFASMTIVMTWRPAGPIAPTTAEYGFLRRSASVDFTIDARGHISDCLVVENGGFGEPLEDPCPYFKKSVQAPFASDETAKHRGLGIGMYIFAQPK